MNIAAEYDYYTLDQAREILQQQRHHEWLVTHKKLKRIKRKQRNLKIYYIKQKLLAALVLFIGLLAAILLPGTEGMTLGVFLWLMGVPLFLSKKKWLVNNYWEECDGKTGNESDVCYRTKEEHHVLQ
ncbi:hypothetical protein [uncultured Robinsoniella sp.]|jgi:hypothetical protein|uniref:hypothetical protein n=1 Tax=uncultured Robinsoniella sp. TaxID=904190 RepID=UPI00374E7E01